MNFKMRESYRKTKFLRNLQQKDYNNEIKHQAFKSDLNEDQKNVMNQIAQEIISNDPNIVKNALNDLLGQQKVLSNDQIVSYLSFAQIKSFIDHLSQPDFSYLCLQILSKIRVDEYTNILLDFNFIQFAENCLCQPNRDFVYCSVIIITNNSLVSHKFRNQAYDKKIFHLIKNNEIIDIGTKAWSLESALKMEPYHDNIEEEISQMLIEISENPDNSFNYKARHHAIKAFNLLESRNYTTFHHVILRNHYINALTDIYNNDPKLKYRQMALEVISGCCICGNDCLSQVFNYDTINIFTGIFQSSADDDYIIIFSTFLINSIMSCDCMYISKLVDRFCNLNVLNLFINHSSLVYPKVTHAIQRLFSVTENPETIAKALSPELIAQLSDIIFIDNFTDYTDGNTTINVFIIFENIINKLITFKSTSPILHNVLNMLVQVVQREDYYKLIFEENEDINSEIQKRAILLKNMVEELLSGFNEAPVDE